MYEKVNVVTEGIVNERRVNGLKCCVMERTC